MSGPLESEYEYEYEYELPPVQNQPLTNDEQLARSIVDRARKNGDPLPPLGGGYNAARLLSHGGIRCSSQGRASIGSSIPFEQMSRILGHPDQRSQRGVVGDHVVFDPTILGLTAQLGEELAGTLDFRLLNRSQLHR